MTLENRRMTEEGEDGNSTVSIKCQHAGFGHQPNSLAHRSYKIFSAGMASPTQIENGVADV